MSAYRVAWLAVFVAIAAHALCLGGDLVFTAAFAAILTLAFDIAQMVRRGDWATRTMTPAELAAWDEMTHPSCGTWCQTASEDDGIATDWRGA